MARHFDHGAARALMVERQLARRGVRAESVLNAMREVPRERFVSDEMQPFAYLDSPLPIGAGQTISQPFIVAAMIEAAAVGREDRVLEIGAGSGYAAAVLSRIAKAVFAIERHADLAASAAARLKAIGYDNVEVRAGDGTLGLAEKAPFDVIIVSAGGPSIPRALQAQLNLGGRLVMPVGAAADQRLMRITRVSAAHFEQDDLGGVAFVPLVGAWGWRGADEADEEVGR
jgi:protein-L-isoaspartate(D-aspartate) O-methyltransferase